MFSLPDLNERVQALMLEELACDVTNGEIYESGRLSATGRDQWVGLLGEALAEHTPEWLTSEINQRQLLVAQETSQRNGRPYTKAVPHDAAQTLAEGQFMRYYLRSVALRALEMGHRLEVVRLKQVQRPRTGSEMRLGEVVDPLELLESLRTNQGIDPFLEMPQGPNSGLGVRTVQ